MSVEDEEPDAYSAITRLSLTETVAARIQKSILGDELRPGDQLPPQRELGKKLGVSATVVREALKRLEERGLIETRPGVGSFVTSLAPKNVAQVLSLFVTQSDISVGHLYQVRKLMEAEIVTLAAMRATPADLGKLDRSIERMDNHIGNAEEHVDADFDFHLALAEATQNPVFVVLTLTMMDVLQKNRSLIHKNLPPARERTRRDHYQIRDCLKNHDASGAKRIMLQHLNQSEKDAMFVLSQTHQHSDRLVGDASQRRSDAAGDPS